MPGFHTISSPPIPVQAGQEGYLDVFQAELDAFKRRVKEYSVKPKGDTPKEGGHQSVDPCGRLDPREVLESLPPVRRQSSPSLLLSVPTSNQEPQGF